MLGWIFIVERLAFSLLSQNEESIELRKKNELGSWKTSIHGANWINLLDSEGKASKILFHGYPSAYILRAAVFKEVFLHGVPKHDGFLVIGDDYVSPGSAIFEVVLNQDRISSLKDADWLVVYLWDMS